MKFTIIIPSFNSQKYILTCLKHICELDYQKTEYEIIVVDGGSKDGTLDILGEFRDIKVVHSDNISISNSRNIAARYAAGNVLVFVDSDCIVDRQLLRKADLHLDKYVCCGAFYKTTREARWVARLWLIVEDKVAGPVDWITAGTLVVDKNVFFMVGGFDESLITGEDVDLGRRLRERGYVIFNDPMMASIHLGQSDNIREFFMKEMWRGRSFIKDVKKNGISKLFSKFTLLIISYFIILCGTFLAVISWNMMSISTFGLCLLGIPLYAAFIKTFQSRKLCCLPGVFILILVYLVARSLSLLVYRQDRDFFSSRQKQCKR